jgi:3-oxoacyl-[acyl-carrier protein] reductase
MAKFALDGKVTVVTGAETGFGAAVAAELARRGAILTVQYDTSFADAKRLVRDIERDGGRAIAVKADLVDRAQAEALCAKAAGALGEVDVMVVNTAGLPRGPGSGAPAEAAALTQARLQSALTPAQAVLPGMAARADGSLLYITEHPGTGASPAAACMAVAAQLAAEAGPDGVRINTVVTGTVRADAGPRVADAVALLAGDGLGRVTGVTLTLGPAARLG